jgi:anti-sigma regulatory factor (Ser/Thr protein kinase)
MATAAARHEGLSESETGAAAIIASEAASNLHKHAQRGELLISRLSDRGGPGVEILSIDRGPGIRNLERCFEDGYSSSDTAGTGLGAMRRLSQECAAYSQTGKGTVLAARIRPKTPARESRELWPGIICVPMKGEEVCGDAWAIRRNGQNTTVMIADGLGHGVFAADAARAATGAFRDSQRTAPADLLTSIHQALRGTRGAAVAIASIDGNSRRIRYAGLGNISGVILGGPKPRYMLSHNGTAGHEARVFQEFEYDAQNPGRMVMHSDGITTSWTLDAYPGLTQRDPALIAAVLYRDANRERDDVCIVVLGV